jgi:hypothetical protein
MVQTPLQFITGGQFQAVMGAELDASPAMQTDIDVATGILVYRPDRTGNHTSPTPNTFVFANDNATTGSLPESPGRAGRHTGGRVATETEYRQETGGQAAG